MPLHALPAGEFVNRQIELNWLKRLARIEASATTGNVLLEGTRGIGKTELLKQIYRSVFYEEKSAVPFYYSFNRANLRISHFARDYFTRFFRQYIAYLKQDPLLAQNTGTPLTKLYAAITSLKADWLIDLLEDFHEVMKGGDMHAQMLTAISAPLTAAARAGRPLLIMLDDFALAAHLHESAPGDAAGVTGLFEEALQDPRCRHIITGSPEDALETIFCESSFRRKAERMSLVGLPDDAARDLFLSLCSRNGIHVAEEELSGFIRCMNGSPLYLKNMARALEKRGKKEFSKQDLWECYVYEVSEGETAYYWQSVLFGHIKDGEHRKIAVKLLSSFLPPLETQTTERQARILGIAPSLLRQIVGDMERTGMVRGGLHISVVRDAVLIDCITCLAETELEGRNRDWIQAALLSRYLPENAGQSHFEIVIPADTDAELVAASAMEQIGKNLNVNPEIINHLQIALIESCLNAIEHSGGYERRVFLKVIASPERIEIVIESPGKFFDPEAVEKTTAEAKLNSSHKRGWGLKLMRSVMDEVKVERVGERTRMTLIKKITMREEGKL